MYIVKGGVFASTNWDVVIPGTEEEYGPFDTYEKAEEAWKRNTFTAKLDTCTHRLFIIEV